MKRSLTFKLILCYIIIVFFIITIGNTIGSSLIKDYLTTTAITDMSVTADSILHSSILKEYFSVSYTENKEKNTETEEDLLHTIDVDITEYLYIISKSTKLDIWLLNKNEKFIYTSTNNEDFINKDINKYYPRFVHSSNTNNVYIKNLTPAKSLCKISKITKASEQIAGYLVVSMPINSINEKHDSFMATLNTLIIIVCVLIAIIFVLIYFLTIQPIHKLTDYAISATQGKVNNIKLKIKSNDEYRDLGNALIYLSNELNNLDEYQRKFISNISHDFRSPLTSIKGYLDAMLDGTIPPENYEKYIKIILFEADRLTNLTTNLLTLNNLDVHQQLLDKTVFDINYIISKTVEVYEGRCQKQKIKLITKFESATQNVYADQSKIQQVINNLLDNAIKFSPANSRIILSTYIKSEKAFISIKDFGSGIPKESISHIWERFYKIDSSRGKDKRGTGLGLAITKDIINAHHENINVTSTEGVGTEFTFSLPKRTN